MSASAAKLHDDMALFCSAGVAGLALYVAEADRACELFLREVASLPVAADVEVRVLDFDRSVQVIVRQHGRRAWRCFNLERFAEIRVGRTIAIQAAIRNAEQAARKELDAGGGESCLM